MTTTTPGQPTAPTQQELGYLRGLRAAASFVHTFDQDILDFDQETTRKIARGLDAMEAAATKRITGVDPAPKA